MLFIQYKAVKRFKRWYSQRFGGTLNLLSLDKILAEGLLNHFFLEIRTEQGDQYEPRTLTSYRNGLRRYFLQRDDGPNLTSTVSMNCHRIYLLRDDS